MGKANARLWLFDSVASLCSPLLQPAHHQRLRDSNPAFTYWVEGLVAGDTEDEALQPGKLVTAAEETSQVGDYGITEDPEHSFASPLGYVVEIVPGTLTVHPRPIKIAIKPAAKVYGDPDPEFEYEIIEGQLIGGDRLAGIILREPGEDVGTYQVTPSGLSNPNYEISYENGTLLITPRPTTVKADTLSKRYGEPDPELTYTVVKGRLVGFDRLQGNLAREPGEEPGRYAIGQGTLSHRNYAITFVGGTLVILPGTASLPEDYRAALAGLMSMMCVCYLLSSGGEEGTDYDLACPGASTNSGHGPAEGADTDASTGSGAEQTAAVQPPGGPTEPKRGPSAGPQA